LLRRTEWQRMIVMWNLSATKGNSAAQRSIAREEYLQEGLRIVRMNDAPRPGIVLDSSTASDRRGRTVQTG
jgi:hypothetical protein